ncbi:hypothetical protein OG863_38155 [Streptomyces decoyicus]|uniref:Integral membrane protein n=1 Tax=Streptomyces decoyicus TaxID=249567 RepID=A0ABZ1FS52_9ACTN|nr:hypothetical protein [Streptomyces decoyicus]WSB73302.1 hypothetical protein OG863_38155 [Streptomyces decoyicus]
MDRATEQAQPAKSGRDRRVTTQLTTSHRSAVLVALIALAANSGAYNAGIAAGAALGGLVLPLADVRGTFLVGGLLTVGACTVLLGGRLLRHGPESAA